MGVLRHILAHPLTRGHDIDSPQTTEIRAAIIRQKGFLRRLYREWYELIAATLPPPPGEIVELGSGAGFLKEIVPGAITSDLMPLPGVDRVVDAQRLPFREGELRAITMTNVLHHMPRVGDFLAGAARCVRPGGVISAIEPWVTPWSRFVYRRLHHEPFDPGAAAWEFPDTGPLSGANGALPWMLLVRDRARLEREHPSWEITQIRRLMPISFLLAGGVSMRSLLPGFSYPVIRAMEAPLASQAMFAHIVLRRRA